MDLFYYPGPAADVRVVAEAGHIAIVGREPRQLPPIMHAAALAAGCLREGTAPAPVVPQSLAPDPAKPLREVLIKLADEAKAGTVDGEGRPLPDAVREELGINVSDIQVFEEWANIEQQLLGDEPTPPPIEQLTDQQIDRIRELSEASFRTLQERVSTEADGVVLKNVLMAESRRPEPRATVVALLERRLKALPQPEA